MKYEPGQRVIFTKRGEQRYYDTDWPATYVKQTQSGRHSIRMDHSARIRSVRPESIRPAPTVSGNSTHE